MPQSFACLHCHIIFSTTQRQPLLEPATRPELFQYIGGILRERDCALISAGGVADHVHLLASLSREISVADAVRDVKAGSSKWLRRELKDFGWQNGYGAFTVSLSQIDGVKKYLANQETHHRKKDFKEEFLWFLKKHGLEYDERYVFQ